MQLSTVSAFLRRLHAASARLGHLVRAGASTRIDRDAANVTVVAIQSLHEQAQRFVVGALLKETFQQKEATGQRLPLSVIVLDELNKYAPREGTSPLKDMLIDIAQRGRSLGVLLVGAQQSASRVAPEVLENASIRVSGRLDAAEAERAEYGWMLPSTRARARLLKPGTMVVSQPAVPVPLVVTFPFPPWATRREEVAADGEDPFAGSVASRHADPPHRRLAHRAPPRPARPHRRRCARRSTRSRGSPTRSSVDLVLVAGDVFDRAAPPVESLSLGLDALLRLARGRPVVVVAGNHDAPELFDALAPLLRDRGRPPDRQRSGRRTPAACSVPTSSACRRSSPGSRSCARDA